MRQYEDCKHCQGSGYMGGCAPSYYDPFPVLCLPCGGSGVTLKNNGLEHRSEWGDSTKGIGKTQKAKKDRALSKQLVKEGIQSMEDIKKASVTYQAPKYFNAFSRLLLEAPDAYQLRGHNLIIEKLEAVERKTEGGIIIAEDRDQVINSHKTNEAVLGLVLLAGSGFLTEDKHDVCDIVPGMLIICPRYSIEYYSTFPGINDLTSERLGRVDASEVKFLYKDLASFAKAQDLLNS